MYLNLHSHLCLRLRFVYRHPSTSQGSHLHPVPATKVHPAAHDVGADVTIHTCLHLSARNELNPPASASSPTPPTTNVAAFSRSRAHRAPPPRPLPTLDDRPTDSHTDAIRDDSRQLPRRPHHHRRPGGVGMPPALPSHASPVPGSPLPDLRDLRPSSPDLLPANMDAAVNRATGPSASSAPTSPAAAPVAASTASSDPSPGHSSQAKRHDKHSAGHMIRSGIAGGLAGCAVRIRI